MQLKLLKITSETSNIRSFRFEKPFDFKPGQWVMIFSKVNDELVKRAYSISTSPTIKDYFEISIKLSPKGTMTHHLFDDVKEGDNIEIMGPFGFFNLVLEEENMVFIAGGSGITPFRSMARYALDTDMQNKIHLIYAAKTPKDLAFKHEFDELQSKNPNFKVHYTVDTPDEGWVGDVGLISSELLKKHIQNLKDNYFYVVGPQPMITLITDILKKEGVEESHLHLDNWG